MERYFYFGENDVDTTGEAWMFALSSFLGMTPRSATKTKMHFKSRNGALTDDFIEVEHVGTTPRTFMKAMVGFMNSHPRNPFLLIHDGESNTTMPGLPTITAVVIGTEA